MFIHINLILILATFTHGADEDFRTIALHRHNTYRRHHDARVLHLSEELNQSAQEYAEHLANTGTFQHSGVPYGENLLSLEGNRDFGQAARQATDTWYREVGKYSYTSPGFSSTTQHFTQLVWKSTTKLGVGIAHGRDGHGNPKVLVVAHYYPRGNTPGEETYATNVVPARIQIHL